MKSQWIRRGLPILSSVVILAAVFIAGIAVGRWSMRAEERIIESQIIPGGHGAVGKVQAIQDNTLVLNTREGTVYVVVNDQTTVESGPRRKAIKLTDLKPGDRVSIIGEPNADGQIDAKVINQIPANSPGNSTQPTRTPNPK
jgi:hypothetical protein